MKKQFSLLLTILILSMPPVLKGQTPIQNIYESLSRVETDYQAFTFDSYGVQVQDTESGYHIQSIAYRNGYYYIVRSRPESSNNQKLLIVSEPEHKVVEAMLLEPLSYHPGGIQIYNDILLVPFAIEGDMAKLCFYSLSNPTSPSLIGSHITKVGNAYCAGITEYDGKYLVAHYYSRPGYIRFYLFDSSFNLLKEKRWKATDQDRSNWYPLLEWPDDTYNYENMSLVKTDNGYFMIMYHSSNAADIYSLSDPNLYTDLDINMVYRLSCEPFGKGFRYGSGMAITDSGDIRFFSTLKHIYDEKSENVISLFSPNEDWPWRLNYSMDMGGQVDVAIDENNNCVEMHCGIPGESNENALFYRVGKLDPTTDKIDWGLCYNTETTGKSVSIAMANSGYCVEVYRSIEANTNEHYYRVGEIDTLVKSISWGPLYNYGSGGEPALAMDDNNHVVEVHRGSPGTIDEDKHYYMAGTLDTDNKIIDWSDPIDYGVGGNASITMDNNGNCVGVHSGGPEGESESMIYYRLGSIDFSTGSITWGDSMDFHAGGDFDVTMNDHGQCLVIHRGNGAEDMYNHYYCFGSVDNSSKTISWGNSIKYDTGGLLSAAINNNGDGVEIHLGKENGTDPNCHFYRLIGYNTQSSTTNTDYHFTRQNSFLIYPNPANKTINIELTAQNTGEVMLCINDVSGRALFNKDLGHYNKGERISERISLGGSLKQGMYFAKLVESGKVISVKKLIVK